VKLVRHLEGFHWDDANWRKSEVKHRVAATEATDVLLNDPGGQTPVSGGVQP